jgi:hypothetical protein
MQKTEPVQLQDSKILSILAGMPDHMLQGKRMVSYVAANPRSPSGYVSQQCSLSNLSDVSRYVNPYLAKHNLMIGCEKPIIPIINKFLEKSSQFLWSIYSVPKAANDDVYQREADT